MNTIYLRETMYIVTNDYLGNPIKNNIIILSSENKILSTLNHPFFKTNVIYYHDKLNNVFVYYNTLTKNYIGYSKDNKNFTSYTSSMYIEVISSIKDMIMNIGLENQFYNILHISPDLELPKVNKSDIFNILTKIIRTRCNNMRQIIYRTASIIEKVKNNFQTIPNIYNTMEHKLVGEFQRSLKKFNTMDSNNKNLIFSKMYTITNNISINQIETKDSLTKDSLSDIFTLSKQYIDTIELINMNNMDCKLIFYYIHSLSQLIEYNELPAIRTNICHMIIKIIMYSYSSYYIPLENYQIRKFDSILLTEAPYIDESQKVVGYYKDLVNINEIDDEKMKEEAYDMNEEMTALDVDDFEKEDLFLDYEAMDEVLDNVTEYTVIDD